MALVKERHWVETTRRKLRGPRRRPIESPPLKRTGTQSYTSDLPPADENDFAERRALAQPSQRATKQELRDQYVDAMIYPWVRAGVESSRSNVLMKCNSDGKSFGTKESSIPSHDYFADLITATIECQPHIQDEHSRLALLADEIFDEAQSVNAFTLVCERLEAMNAREVDTGRHTDEYVAAELRLYHLSGAWELNLTGDELYNLVQEVEGDLAAYDSALRNSV